jgi:murein DD-endopeptidase MepM/ murein hydrolase activator NlpD
MKTTFWQRWQHRAQAVRTPRAQAIRLASRAGHPHVMEHHLRMSARNPGPESTTRSAVSPVARYLRAWRRRHWLLCGVAATTLVTVMGVLPGLAMARREAPGSFVQTTLPIPPAVERAELEVAALAADEAMSLAFDGAAEGWRTVEIARGDTLGAVFAREGFGGNDLNRALASPQVQELAGKLRPGAQIAMYSHDGRRLEKLMFDRGEDARVLVHFEGEEGFRDEILERQLQYRIERSTGVIEDSLFGSAREAGLSNVMVLKIAKVLGYDIDFAQDLREGDSFAVVYEQVYRDGEMVRDGDVLAVSFVNRGKRYVALRHVQPDGKVEYFDQDGRPMRKDFLRTPVDFTRISSRFSLARKHPILARIRAHRGVDYAAPTGTPIYAAGDARVQFRGRQNGYGNTIILDHGNSTTTLYAHLSRFNNAVRQGARVRQGDVIGYVGMTGTATGPHLHYEFRVKGVHRDPLTVTLPKAEPLKGPALDRFRRDTMALASQLELIESNRALAAR